MISRTYSRWLLPVFFLLALLVSSTSLMAAVQSVPALTRRVNDYAAMISPVAREEIERKLAAFEVQESTQIAILTVPSLQGEPIEEFSIRVADAWKLGSKEKDNGLLLVVSKGDHKARIEVGYGLEGRMTDLQAGQIIRDIIQPAFARGDFDAGFTEASDAMIAALKGEFKADEAAKTQDKGERPSVPFILIILFVLFFYIRLFGGSHRGGPFVTGGWPGSGGGIFSSGGGGGFSGGGGGFGGGGASGDW